MMVEIDRERCVGCGSCVEDCIRGALALREDKAAYVGDCFGCGHCVAICPTRAVTMPGEDMADVEEWELERFALEIDRLLRAVKFRRSVRRFADRPVESDKLEKLFQIGRYTATGGNRQGCRFILVQDRLDRLKEMVWAEVERMVQCPGEGDAARMAESFRRFLGMRAEGVDYLFRDAPAVLYVAAESAVDAALAAQNIELAAVAQGLGALYNGFLVRASGQDPALLDWLGAGDKPLRVCMLLGHPAVRYRRTVPRRAADVCLR